MDLASLITAYTALIIVLMGINTLLLGKLVMQRTDAILAAREPKP